jgi:hypothetical protein
MGDRSIPEGFSLESLWAHGLLTITIDDEAAVYTTVRRRCRFKHALMRRYLILTMWRISKEVTVVGGIYENSHFEWMQ